MVFNRAQHAIKVLACKTSGIRQEPHFIGDEQSPVAPQTKAHTVSLK